MLYDVKLNKALIDKFDEYIYEEGKNFSLFYSNHTFRHKDYKVEYVISNLNSNCGVRFISHVRFKHNGGNTLNYKEYSWKSSERYTKVDNTKEVEELYLAFMYFVCSYRWNFRDVLLFTDAVGGENGDNYPSLYKMAAFIGIPPSEEMTNRNSGNEIVSYWTSTSIVRELVEKKAKKIGLIK